MHIRELLHKTTAFTLAEMMVILTVMSVVMAATMPIITAPDSAVLSGDGSSNEEHWTYSSTFKSISTPNFIAVGMAPTVNTPSVGTASLFVQRPSNYAGTHILFTSSPDGNTVYNAGRLNMGTADKPVVALGASAMEPKDNSTNQTKSVAIGDRTMYHANAISSVAIGSHSLYEANSTNSVGLGAHSLAKVAGNRELTQNNTVGIGYMAGAYDTTDSAITVTKNVNIGYMAGYNGGLSFNTNIGYQAGALTLGSNNVNIGEVAGFNSPSETINATNVGRRAGSALYAATYQSTWQDVYANKHVALGDHALADLKAGADEIVAIGSYAGYNLRGDSKGAVFIGYKAGLNIQQGNPNNYNTVAIGNYANYKTSGTAVAIGYRAGALQDLSSVTTYAGNGRSSKVNEKTLNEVAIGYRAGEVKNNNTVTSYGNIMIGQQSAVALNSGLGSIINSICIGGESCDVGTNVSYSLLLGKYASIAPSVPTGKKGASFSLLSFEWPNRNYKHNLIASFGMGQIEGNSVMHYKNSDAHNYGQIIIAPVRQSNDSTSEYTSSAIILDATNLYGPTLKPTGYTSSDKSLKENIHPLKYSLKDLGGVNIYEYNYVDEASTRRIGVIAQELMKIMPESVVSSDKKGYVINPDWVFYPVINAVKELDKTVESCRVTLVAYANEYKVLSKKMKMLEAEQKQIERERKSLERQINRAYRKAEKMEKSV